MTTGDRIFKQLQYCKRHEHDDDLHSFMVDINGGVAYVEVRDYGEVFIETRTGNPEKVTQWAGTMIAAANRLETFGADPDTIRF